MYMNSDKGISRCSEQHWKSLSRNWEIADLRNSPTYMKVAANLIKNQTYIIFNVTARWTEAFTKKSQEIQKLNSSSLICQLASYNWLKLNTQYSPT